MSEHPSTFPPPFPGAPAEPAKPLRSPVSTAPRGGSIVPRNPLKTGRPIERRVGVVRTAKGFIVTLIPTPATARVNGLGRDFRFFLASDDAGSESFDEAVIFSTREAASRVGTRASRAIPEVGAFQVLAVQEAQEKYGSRVASRG